TSSASCVRPSSKALAEGEDLERERWVRDRLHRQFHQQQRVVVARGAVRDQRVAAATAVDEHPFAATAYRNGERFHPRAAVGGAVTGPLVDVFAPQAVRTMVAMRGAGGVHG